jgi:hypothetical protein
MTNHDELSATVKTNVEVTLGDDGEQLLDLVKQIKEATTGLALARQSLQQNGYDLLLSTNDTGELVVEVVSQ